jgi:hypothetical protein
MEMSISGEMTLQCVYGTCIVHGYIINTKSREIQIHSDSLIIETFRMKNKEVNKKYEKILISPSEFECVLFVKFKKLETNKNGGFISEEFKIEMNKIKKEKEIQVIFMISNGN